MVVFDAKNFDEISYLQFDPNFKLEVGSKIKIVLGPNGVGKSSIYANIKRRHPEYSYIDYNDVENSVLEKKDKIKIAASIVDLEKKQQEKVELLNSLSVSDNIKSFDLGSKPKCLKISPKLNDYRTNSEEAISKYVGNKLDAILSLDENSKNMFIKYGAKIINQICAEVKLKEIEDNYKKRYLEMIDKLLNGDEYECPVCGSICDESIKDIISKKIANLTDITNDIVQDYVSDNPTLLPEDIEKKINGIKQFIVEQGISIDDLEDYFICGGDKSKSDLIISSKEKISQLNNEIMILEANKLQFYHNVKIMEDRVRKIFENQLNVPSSNIIFNDTTNEIEISMSRKISEYSTGEINLITFIISLLEFVSSDRKYLIIDDPLSSYDIPNQYKIMYEITSINNNDNFILILTHNIDCLNIANSQNKGSYEYEILDRVNNCLYLNSITDKFGDKGFHMDFILDKLDGSYAYTDYLKLLSRKDSLSRNDPVHTIFHYDLSVTLNIDGISYRNDDLVSLIDNLNLTNVINDGYLINSAYKVIYLAALRVWIEKKFLENTDDPNGLQGKMFAAKIIFLFDDGHWTGEPSVTKSYLMSKKVLLNQNDHVDSQKEPFYYALSISTDEIINEIIDIKSRFS